MVTLHPYLLHYRSPPRLPRDSPYNLNLTFLETSMSTSNSVGRSPATFRKDRSRLCAFTFADGRQCRTPRRSGRRHLCCYHAKKEAEALIAKQAGEDLASLSCGKYPCASDFTAALGRVLSAVARGYIKPKTAVSLALLGHTLNQSIKIAQDEIRQCSWRKCPARAQWSSWLVLPAPPEPPSLVAQALRGEHSASAEPNLNHHRNQFRPKLPTI